MHMLKSSVFGCVIVSSRAFRKTLDDLCVWRKKLIVRGVEMLQLGIKTDPH